MIGAYRKLPGRRREFLKGASVWNRPLSLVRRNRWRFVAAVLISLTQICLLSGRFRELQ